MRLGLRVYLYLFHKRPFGSTVFVMFVIVSLVSQKTRHWDASNDSVSSGSESDDSHRSHEAHTWARRSSQAIRWRCGSACCKWDSGCCWEFNPPRARYELSNYIRSFKNSWYCVFSYSGTMWSAGSARCRPFTSSQQRLSSTADFLVQMHMHTEELNAQQPYPSRKNDWDLWTSACFVHVTTVRSCQSYFSES